MEKNAYIGHILSFASIYIAPYFLLHYIVIVHPTTSKIMKTTLLASIYSFLCGSILCKNREKKRKFQIIIRKTTYRA